MSSAVWRVCPRCAHVWSDRSQWEDETALVGTETRRQGYFDDLGVRHDFEICIDVRRHPCGGEMYSRGRVVWQNPPAADAALEAA